jgi:hypothetical protein
MTDWTPERRLVLRVGIAVMAVTPALVGIWATVAPRGFYRDFPGVGQSWVALVGPYDEHLVRDVGALYLGALALLVLAWVWLDRRLVQATLISYAVAAVPHFVYHLTELDGFRTADAVAEIAGLALNVVLPLILLALSGKRSATPSQRRST